MHVGGPYKHGQWDWTNLRVKHIGDDKLLPNVLRWKIDVETSLKIRRARETKSEFSEIRNLISYTNRLTKNEIMNFNKKKNSSFT